MSTGQLANYRLGPTRKEDDFLEFIKQTCEGLSKGAKITFLAYQLNVHKSETLVQYVASHIGYKDDLGTKQYKGILKSQASRMSFLETENHRIRIVYTPRHWSWLNPIVNWIGKLQKQRLKHLTVCSIEEIIEKIRTYIDFYNEYMAKPYRLKFTGFNTKGI